jgi:hypothetical protein
VNTCPYCSEALQEAAVSCPACGCAFPQGIDEPQPRGWGRIGLGLAVVGLGAFVAYPLLLMHPDARKRDEAGRCLLRAHVYADATRRMFGIQNLDTADWTDVEVTISGDHLAGPAAGKQTGPFVYHLPISDSSIAVHRVREITLDEFQDPAGPRWIPITMRVTAATVTGKIAGEACTVETAVPEPGSVP